MVIDKDDGSVKAHGSPSSRAAARPGGGGKRQALDPLGIGKASLEVWQSL